MQDDRALERFFGVHEDRERFVVDEDQLRGVGTLGLGLGDDGDHGLAHVADHVGRQPGLGHLLVEHRHLERQRVQLDVGGCDHGQDPRRAPRLVDVDGADAGMGGRRPHVGHAGRPVDLQVVDVGAPAGEELGVFLADDAVTEDAHALPPETATDRRSGYLGRR